MLDAEAAPGDLPAALPVTQLDIRVGRILEIAKHPDADRCCHGPWDAWQHPRL